MKSTLKTKIKIFCNTCGITLVRRKSFKVNAENKEAAIVEANEKIEMWKKSLEHQNCKICQSILNDIEKDKRS